MPIESTEDKAESLIQEFEKLLVGEMSSERIVQNLQHLDMSLDNKTMFSNALGLWLAKPNWEDEVSDTGANPNAVYDSLMSIFVGSTSRNYKDFSTPKTKIEEEPAAIPVQPSAKVPSAAGKNGTPEVVVPGSEVNGEDKKVDVNVAVTAGLTPDQASATFKENMRQAFYETVYSQPWGGRAEFQSLYPAMLSETKTLFLMNEGIGGWKEIKKLDKKTTKAGKSELASSYKIFLEQYLRNPQSYRSGADFRKQVTTVRRVLTLIEDDTGETSGKWSTEDKAARPWVTALFSDMQKDTTSKALAKANRTNLLKLMATNGRQGAYSNMIHSAIGDLMTHYRNLGMSEHDIFKRLAVRSDEGVINPAGSDPVQYSTETKHRWKLPPTLSYSMKKPILPLRDRQDKDDEEGIYAGPDPRLSYAGEPTEIDRDIDRILSRSSGMQVPSPRNVLIENRMEFHDETLDEATDWVECKECSW